MLEGHSDFVRAMAFLPDGKLVVASPWDTGYGSGAVKGATDRIRKSLELAICCSGGRKVIYERKEYVHCTLYGAWAYYEALSRRCECTR
jgi:hypothetical protein